MQFAKILAVHQVTLAQPVSSKNLSIKHLIFVLMVVSFIPAKDVSVLIILLVISVVH